MEKTYRVSLAIDLAAMDVVIDENILSISFDVKDRDATCAAFGAVGRFADKIRVDSVVPWFCQDFAVRDD